MVLKCGIFEIGFKDYKEFKEAVERARKDKKIRKACEEWVKEWSFIPTRLLEIAYGETSDDIEIIAPALEDYKKEYIKDGYCYRDGDCESCRYESCRDSYFENVPKIPARGYIFTPKEEIDRKWLKACAEIIADWCGVIVYYTEEIGYYVGINGAGYDFYDALWIPLYTLRGFSNLNDNELH